MQPKYYTLTELLKLIDNPNRSICYQFLDDNKDILATARGGKSKHQAWDGGYVDHITEVMNIAVALYEPLDERRPLPFSLSDSLLVLFLHDVDKLWRYTTENGRIVEKADMDNKKKRDAFTQKKVTEYGFQLTEEHQNALKYVEGEVSDYDPYNRIQRPLAAFCHLCDTTSARIWFDFPLIENDPWNDAKRGLSKIHFSAQKA